ncbi:sigma-70 family RNA polymerase sigma factor [Umezawaea beigongshangensis]|uniref:sigma-70 family RNA polymerase sigma factor n=1 Tax=Umezawaea beigongshangensis TaxID=2780383 RepID=UPI0018F11237|nr:sigma-70 family RNA polymerase sigma factor [Umezawaea beigongshangensis]
MATVPADVRGPSDAELIRSVRAGAVEAYGQLYERHVTAAHNLARQLARSSAEADDLVSEAFAKVLNTLRAGRGPDSAFRAYLLTALRHTAYDKTRKDRRVELADDVSTVSGVAAEAVSVPFRDTAVAGLERSMAAEAFSRLPERWQTVLWHTEIEGQSPTEVGPILGLTANGVSALAYRAREGLRQAYLQVHLAGTSEDRCRATVERLGAWTRSGLSTRETAQVESHLDVCERCRALAAELADVNGSLRAVVAPLVLGSVATTGYLAAAGGGTAGTATAAGTGGAAGATGASSSLPRHLTGLIASAAAVVVAVAVALTSGGGREVPALRVAPSQVTSQQQEPSALPPAPSSPPPAPRTEPPPPEQPPPPPPEPEPRSNPESEPEPRPAPAPAPEPVAEPPAEQPAPAALVPTVPSGFALTPGAEPEAMSITVRNSGGTTSEPPVATLALPPGVRSAGPAASSTGRWRTSLPGAAESSACPAGTGTVRCETSAGLPPGGTATFVFRLAADAGAGPGVITGTVTAGVSLSVDVRVDVEVRAGPDDLSLTARRWDQVFWNPRVDIRATHLGGLPRRLDLVVEASGGVVLLAPHARCDSDHHRTARCSADLAPGDEYRVSVWALRHHHHGDASLTVTATLGTATRSVVVPLSPAPDEAPGRPDTGEVAPPGPEPVDPPVTAPLPPAPTAPAPPTSTNPPTAGPPATTTPPPPPPSPSPLPPPSTAPEPPATTAPPTTTAPAADRSCARLPGPLGWLLPGPCGPPS